ncbi:methylenetetrahydrofolate--tRNA-(uracil(54)-C(5))-methyltransferase (FADH(2)-oxidizing) TrmFO [candidate division TA06 bacterium]|uniref:Methylenetetrahydrofolate--tRNA-(uracil-5-)-methyltransferase TrmFO n=1 Tax=candidate division TA06 bacterium TaxID=2250710 RepID=A0A660SAU0_UNCT6|nr:MAG: methylenetetrahydrofolate--tRNA-(uracil(54)-C(5))-methyltransferase (FADH(2)-oxidizing) TrmFO [candidate division TA06 bacterium]
MNEVVIIGGGLAGTEAAYQLAKRGYHVILYEQRPQKTTEAHKTDRLGELVCSNSLKSMEITNAHGLLKYELSEYGSLIIEQAYKNRIAGGKALVVDREEFSKGITEIIEKEKNIEVRREFAEHIDKSKPTIVATGPLSGEFLERNFANSVKGNNLYFYDAISPTIVTESIDFTRAFWGSRYMEGDNAYLNIPLNRDEYNKLVDMIKNAEKAHVHEFDRELFFEGCLPVEEIVKRGDNTLRFSLMKPVGISSPEGFDKPYAVIQLRRENREGTLLNIVGFQTRMTYTEQKRIIRSIAALKNAEIARYGSMHRNAYVKTKNVLNYNLSLKQHPEIFFAGQITGVEGYVESTLTGLIAAVQMDRYIKGIAPIKFSRNTPSGALLNYLFFNISDNMQPMNINFGLFPPIEEKIGKKERRERMVKRAKWWIEKQKVEILETI